MMEASAEGKICSFCARPATLDPPIRGGHGAWICLDCARRFDAIFSDKGHHETALQPPWKTMSDDELLAVLPDIVRTGQQHDDFLHDWVDMLREQGVSWHQIGLTLGVSRQAVWQRFTRPRAEAAKRS